MMTTSEPLISDEAAERAVVGSILVDAACHGGGLDLHGQPTPGREPYRDGALQVAKRRLSPADFSLSELRTIYEAALEADGEGKPVDVVTLGPYLARRGFFEHGEAYDLLWHLGDPDVTPSAANVELYVHQVLDAAARRKVVEAGQWMGDVANDRTEAVSTILDRVERGLERAREGAVEEAEAFDLGQAVAKLRHRLAGVAPSGWRWPTHVDALDRYLAGIGVGEQWVIGGRSGHCKTALALNIAWHALQGGHRVAVFRYEEAPGAMLMRLASLESGIPYGDIHSGRASDDDVAAFDRALVDVGERYGGLLQVHVGLKLPAIEAVVEGFRPDLVIYDTLQAMAEQVGTTHRERRDLEIQSICQFVSRLCVRPENPHAAILISQLRKGQGRPSMAQLRESGAIEEAADVVLLLWWPHRDAQGRCEENLVVRLGKNRLSGRLGTVVCQMEVGTQRIGKKLPDEAASMFLGTVK